MVLPNNFNVFALAPGASASNAKINITASDARVLLESLTGLVLRMERSECGMVDLMPAEFEVPLFAIERVGGVVVKTPDSFHHGGGTPHWSREPNWVSSGDLHPSFMEVALVEKHHFELSDVMFFDIARVGRAASSQERDA